MKKSKIIIPALAIIAFSTAASVAGSVAWFTATRQVTINAGTYAVVKTSSELKCKVTGGVGTTANDTSKTIELGKNKLTDGSFTHVSPQTVFTPNDVGAAIAKGTALSAEDLATQLERGTLSDGGKIYTAVTWEVEFELGFGGNNADVGLYLNTTSGNSAFTIPSGSPATAKGFRMAFIPKSVPSGSEGVARVYADLQTSANCKYVADTNNFAGTAYSGNTLIDSEYSAALPTSETARSAAINRPDYLGTFKFVESGFVKISYTVVAWFEGTDTEVRNRDNTSEYQAVTATLKFDAVALKAAS